MRRVMFPGVLAVGWWLVGFILVVRGYKRGLLVLQNGLLNVRIGLWTMSWI